MYRDALDIPRHSLIMNRISLHVDVYDRFRHLRTISGTNGTVYSRGPGRYVPLRR